MKKVKIKDLEFSLLYTHDAIQERVLHLAKQIDQWYLEKNWVPECLVIMDGAFLFAADLCRNLNSDFTIQFIKIKSYAGVLPNEIKMDTAFDFHSLKNKAVLILEDILDTGNTMFELIKILKELPVLDLKICSFLVKPEVLRKDVKPDWIGYEINPLFVVGYGMDYDGNGRGLSDIYQLVQASPDGHVK
ncbi:MAG: hypoxanthine phosphoribosyltransferase [Saprospiraceae bacterium]|nr:hypoxanthine phosphoribosyltransferase [Saprospiraceae bacterium]